MISVCRARIVGVGCGEQRNDVREDRIHGTYIAWADRRLRLLRALCEITHPLQRRGDKDSRSSHDRGLPDAKPLIRKIKECLVANDAPAHTRAEVVLDEARNAGLKVRLRIQTVVAQIIIDNTVIRIDSRACNDVGNAAGITTELCVEVCCEQAKLAQGVGVRERSATAAEDFIVERAIEVEGVEVRPDAVGGEVDAGCVPGSGRWRVVRNTGNDLDKVVGAAALRWKLYHLSLIHISEPT